MQLRAEPNTSPMRSVWPVAMLRRIQVCDLSAARSSTVELVVPALIRCCEERAPRAYCTSRISLLILRTPGSPAIIARTEAAMGVFPSSVDGKQIPFARPPALQSETRDTSGFASTNLAGKREDEDVPLPIPVTGIGASDDILGEIQVAIPGGPVPPRRHFQKAQKQDSAPALLQSFGDEQSSSAEVINAQHVKSLRSSFELLSHPRPPVHDVQGNLSPSR